MPQESVFRVAGLSKAFGSAQVLRGVSLSLRPGEVTALMGANGAGKSTLVKIVSGVYRISGGSMELDGRPFAPASPADAIREGVVTVHQNINDGVVATLDVATNLTLDRLNGPGSRLFFNPREVRRQARKVADNLGLSIDLGDRIANLSLADRQMVAIARAMAHEPRVLILDEPTSSLSSAEANRLFALIDRLRARGVAILYISHRMSDIRRLADRIVSLRDGVIAGEFAETPLDYEGAVDAMLGQVAGVAGHTAREGGDAIFSARDLRLRRDAKPFSLTLHDGEVVAIAGLVGVGKTALAETLFGVRRPLAGEMTIRGKTYAPASAGEAIAAGVHMLPKDRADNGIVPGFNIYENISLPFLDRLSRLAVSRRGRERQRARTQIESLGIVCRSERDEVATLSGGNQQKVMVSRWMTEPARLFILDEPFQGVDIAARRDIAAKLRASATGRATLILVTELDEALETADRILVMSEHTIVGEHVNRGIDMDRLLAEIAGDPAREAA